MKYVILENDPYRHGLKYMHLKYLIQYMHLKKKGTAYPRLYKNLRSFS